MKYQENESVTLEFKCELPSKDQIVKTMIAFCNHFGGRLIIGVDDKGNVVGVDDADIDKLIDSLHQSIFQSVTPVILPIIYTQRMFDKIIIIIEVSSGMNKPYFRTSEGMNNGTYIRVGSHTLKAPQELIQTLQWQSRGFYADEIPVYSATLEDINLDAFDRCLKERKYQHNEPHHQKLLLQYHLLLEEHKHYYPTVAGILLFGRSTQHYFSESFIICTHFKGTSGREALASVDCVGTLFQQLNDALSFVQSRLNKVFSIQGIKRDEKLEIPFDAIREVVINAVVHRQYQIPGPIKIAIYDDRLEVFSPGNFPGPLHIDDLEMGITYLRNPVIARLFREIGYIEKLGSGFLTLFQTYRDQGLPRPKVIEGMGYVKCILPRPVSNISQTMLTKTEERVMSLFDLYEDISTPQVSKSLGISRQTSVRILSSLVKKKNIIRVGKAMNTRYKKS